MNPEQAQAIAHQDQQRAILRKQVIELMDSCLPILRPLMQIVERGNVTSHEETRIVWAACNLAIYTLAHCIHAGAADTLDMMRDHLMDKMRQQGGTGPAAG